MFYSVISPELFLNIVLAAGIALAVIIVVGALVLTAGAYILLKGLGALDKSTYPPVAKDSITELESWFAEENQGSPTIR